MSIEDERSVPVTPVGRRDFLRLGTAAAVAASTVSTLVPTDALARAAAAAAEDLTRPGADTAFLTGKIVTARFYAEQLLPQAAGLFTPITQGAGTVMELDEDQF